MGYDNEGAVNTDTTLKDLELIEEVKAENLPDLDLI